MSFEWWYWLILGFVLLISEMADGSLLLLGLGFSAIVVGILEYFLNFSLKTQLLFWGIISVLYFLVWIKFIKKPKKSLIEQDYEVTGIAMSDIRPHHDGTVRFDTKLLGSRDWIATSDYEIKKGELVTVEQVIQQRVKVKPLNREE